MLQLQKILFNFVIVILGLLVDDIKLNSAAADEQLDPDVVVEFLGEDEAAEFVLVDEVELVFDHDALHRLDQFFDLVDVFDVGDVFIPDDEFVDVVVGQAGVLH